MTSCLRVSKFETPGVVVTSWRKLLLRLTPVGCGPHILRVVSGRCHYGYALDTVGTDRKRLDCQAFSRESSAARCAAARMAALTAPEKSRCWNTCSAAAVVPPLEVTRSRKTESDSGDNAASWVAPLTVARASRRAWSCGMPCSTAAAIMDSRNRKT